jgi:hypothetical protein
VLASKIVECASKSKKNTHFCSRLIPSPSKPEDQGDGGVPLIVSRSLSIEPDQYIDFSLPFPEKI